MAKQATINPRQQAAVLLQDIENRKFKSVYLLMGEEPYYPDLIVNALLEHVLQPHERDFNQTVVYASDTTAAEIVSLARRYPMFAERQLIVVKEAQSLTKTEPLEMYLDAPAPETVLVLSYTGKSIDKRTGFYKKARAVAEIFESPALREYEIPVWITAFLREKGISIDRDAALLMAEFTGNGLRKIVLEIDKLIKGIPAECRRITVKDIEANIGISREFSAFELCKAISGREYDKAYRIVHFMGENPKKYPLVVTLGALFFYFSKLLRCHAYMERDGGAPQLAVRKAGAYGFQETEYITAMRNYSPVKTMSILSLIREYDYKSKSGAGGAAGEGELLLELVAKMIAVR